MSECKANQEQTKDNIKTDDKPCGGVFSIRCDDEHKKELDRIEKGHSKIVEELQQWVEDGDKENKMLEEIIETTNEENVKLLVQISVMKKELKTLEKENNTLQAELKTKRTEVKNLRAKEHYNERELRNLKRDLKRKEQIIENALAEKQELLDGADYLEGILRDSEEANEQLNVQVNELKGMVKEANKRPDYGYLREEEELLKGSLDVCFHKEKLINIQVEALTADVSHFIAFDETLALLEQVESQLDLCMEENARIMSEKDKELNELNDAKSKVIDDLNDQLAKLTINNARQISEKEKEFKKLIDEKSRFIDRLKDQLTQSESRNATIVSEKTKELNELKMQHLRDDIQLRDELAMSMKDYARIVAANGKMMNQLIEKSRVIQALEDQLAKLKKENARVILDKNKEKMELNIKNARFIEQLEEQLHVTQSESRNATIVSEKTNKELNELKRQHLRDDIQLRDELAMSMKDYARIVAANGKMMNQLIEKSRVIQALEDQLAKLKKENARVILDKNKEKMELNIKNARFIEQLEEQLAKLMRENCAIKGKEHARGETRNLKYQLQEMTFPLNITDSCSEANESKHQVCECREKFFAM